MNNSPNTLPANRQKQKRQPSLSLAKIRFYQTVVILVFTTVFSGGMSIPLVYESQTLWYKVGVDRFLLLLGQLFGMATLILLFSQVVLAIKPKLLASLFGVSNLMKLHRINGVAVVTAAVCHVFLVLVPEGVTNLPVGLKYWPELVGAALLFLLTSLVLLAYFRDRFNLSYRRWRASHWPLGYLALTLVVVHVLFVSDSFEKSVPRLFIIALFCSVFSLVAKERIFQRDKTKKGSGTV